MITHVFIRGYCLSGNVQVVAFEDFKRLSTGTSLAEVKVSGDVLSSFFSRIFHLLFLFFRLLESGARREKVMRCKMVCQNLSRGRMAHVVVHESTGDMVHFQFNVTKDPKKK
jgi:hypothetical protein